MRGPVLAAFSFTDDVAVREAKTYVSRFGLTRDDAAIVKRDDMILVIAKRDCREKLVDNPDVIQYRLGKRKE